MLWQNWRFPCAPRRFFSAFTPAPRYSTGGNDATGVRGGKGARGLFSRKSFLLVFPEPKTAVFRTQNNETQAKLAQFSVFFCERRSSRGFTNKRFREHGAKSLRRVSRRHISLGHWGGRSSRPTPTNRPGYVLDLGGGASNTCRSRFRALLVRLGAVSQSQAKHRRPISGTASVSFSCRHLDMPTGRRKNGTRLVALFRSCFYNWHLKRGLLASHLQRPCFTCA